MHMAKTSRSDARIRRHQRVRKTVSGNALRPRLAVFRSSAEIYAQVIDDDQSTTLAAASSIDHELRDQLKGMKKVEQAKKVGELVAKRAQVKGVKLVVFDRGGFRFSGRVKALADAAREAGLEF
jgi:large subunit ribosomal protein L18